MLRFLFNETLREDDLPVGMVALDFVRAVARQPGTKEGCREGDCGACTVLIGEPDGDGFRYQAVTSCLVPVGHLHGRHLVSVEGLNGPGLSPVQQAIVDAGATQCGFCTPGFVVSLTGFLLGDAPLTEAEALAAIEGNICRCTGYASLVRATRVILEAVKGRVPESGSRLPALVAMGAVPAHFLGARARLGVVPARAPAPEDAAVVAGGTDVFVQKAEALGKIPLRLLADEPGLRTIREDDDGSLTIGAMATHEDLLRAPALAAYVPDIEPVMRLVSSQLIRRRATVAGNIINASPIADVTILLLALGAVVGLRRGGDRRELALASLYKGYKKLDREPGEIIEWVRIPAARRGWRFHFEKVSRRRHLDIASVNTAIGVRMEGDVVAEVTLSAGGVAPIPMVLTRAAAALCGRPITVASARAAMAAAGEEIAPISDVRGSAAYKRLLLQRLLLAHLVVLFPAAGLEESLC